jgi:PAS domain S-box-containing protein
MHQQQPDAASEVKRLQRCINDLVGVLALPAVWSVSEPSRILETFLDALLVMLDLDFLYARVRLDSHEAPIDALRTNQFSGTSHRGEEIRHALNQWFGEDPQRWPEGALRHLGGREVSIFPIRMGIEGELGLIVAGSQRLAFPELTENLVLGVAANQVAIELQQALRLNEQKRVASELDRRVEERTRELAETNEELRLQVGLLQQIPVAAWTLKPDGTPAFVNQVWLEYTGQTVDFVRSHPEAWMTAVHPEDRETVSRSFWDGVRSGQSFEMETRILRAQDETYRWHLNRAVVLRDADGRVLTFVGTSTDIDDRKRAEDELRRSEARYRVVVETASDAVVSIDESDTIILANAATERIFGYRPEELIGRSLTVLMPGAMRKHHNAGFKRYLETGARHLNWQGTELTALRANGEEFPAEVSFGEMTADKRKVFTGFIRDISEKKRAEEAVLSSERNLSLIINTMPVLAWSALPDGTVEFFNQRWLDYTGLSPEQAQGWGWAGALHRDDLGRMTGYWQSMVAAGGPGEIEARFRRFDGDYRWFLFRADPLRDESGAIVNWYGTNTDIDDRKRAEEALRNTQAELARMMRVMTIGQLTASIAHEVSQPLSGIITNASTCLRMLNSEPPNVDGARETVQRTIRDGKRATDVVTRLRTLFSKKQINIERVDLNEATREVVALLSDELQKNRVIVEHQFDDRLPPVNGDRIQLQQVLLNLLRNGSDAMIAVNDRPRQLLIRTEVVGNHAAVHVQDSGVGFDPENTDRLFESFFTTKQEGMGIGLSLSRSIVAAHRGHLWAERNAGFGATFAFSIPSDSGLPIDNTP